MERFKRGIYNYFIKNDVENDTQEIQFGRLFFWIFIIWTISSLVFLFTYKHNGEFGDMFGSVNTLFSGLAFGGIIYTIFLQREDMRVQKKEADKNNAKLQEQIKEINIERFENTFFQMITLHNEITKSITIDNCEGRLAFTKFYEQLKYHKTEFDRFNPVYKEKPSAELEIRDLRKMCDQFFRSNEPIFGHYYRNLYNLYRMVDNNKWIQTTEEKKEYTRIIRSQLSAHEYVLLFYNCFQKKGYKFKFYADKYELFDNMSENLLLSRKHLSLYSLSLDTNL